VILFFSGFAVVVGVSNRSFGSPTVLLLVLLQKGGEWLMLLGSVSM
jgi:hypothetical protein